jgi:hypothetical protein
MAIESPTPGPEGLETYDPLGILEVIEIGLQCHKNGMISIWNAEIDAAVHLYEGRVAWAWCSAHHEYLGDVLRRRQSIAARTLEKCMEESRLTGRRLGEVLVEANLVTESGLRGCLREHVARHLTHLLCLGDKLHARFSAREHRYDPRFVFALEELVDQHTLLRSDGPQMIAEYLAAIARERVPKGRAVAVVDRDDGYLCGYSRDPALDSAALAALARAGLELRDAAAVVGSTAPEDPLTAVFMSRDDLVIVSPVDWHPRWRLVVVCGSQANLAPALRNIESMCRRAG